MHVTISADIEGFDLALQCVPCRLAADVDTLDPQFLAVSAPRLGHPDFLTIHPPIIRKKAITTSLYARSDVVGITIPIESGGCGTFHGRPVIKGAPAKVFRLDCPPCESYLKGDRKQKILKYQIDKNTGQSIRQERIADSDDRWGSSPDSVPLTPDEERTNTTRSERGAMQIQMLQALAVIRRTGIDVPPEAMWLLEREIPEGVLKGTILCANAHDNAAGVKFCSECGIAMNVRGAISQGDEDEPAAVDLGRLAYPTLRKMCRDQGLPDKGSKDVLIGRLEAA